MTTFNEDTIRKWRRGTHHLPRAIGDVARDVLDELVRLQAVNRDLLDAAESLYQHLDANIDQPARLIPVELVEAVVTAIERARKPH